MANSYKFKGTALATTAQTTLLSADTNETIIIKSIIVTNNTGNTPTVTLDVTDSSASSTFTILKTKSLTANNSEEVLLFGIPLVLESSDSLKATISSTDSIHITMSYLIITWLSLLEYQKKMSMMLGVWYLIMLQMHYLEISIVHQII